MQYEDVKNRQQFGKIWGKYEGSIPTIFVADPDVIKDIVIKDFDHFIGIRPLRIKNEYFQESLSILRGGKWKTLRTALNPLFTSKKLKTMSVFINGCVESLTTRLTEKIMNSGNILDMYKEYQGFMCDVIGRCLFGLKISSFDLDSNDFIRHGIDVNSSVGVRSPMLMLPLLFPYMLRFSEFAEDEGINFFIETSRSVMEERMKSKEFYGDMIDHLIEMKKKLHDPELKKNGITEKTLLGQGFVLFIAAFVTTTTTLSCASYFLSKNPEAQERAAEEVRRVVQKHGSLTHDILGHLDFLSACLQETLRLCPVLFRMERMCNKDYHHPKGDLRVPRGTVVKIPIYAMHHDPELFPDPEEFRPERFLRDEQEARHHPYAYLPFGAGPRMCLGMRFAQETMKLAMAHLLLRFRILPCHLTELQINPGFMYIVETISIKEMKLKLEERAQDDWN